MTKKINSKKSFSMAVSLLMTLSLIAPGVTSSETTSQLHQPINNPNLIAKEKISDRLLENFNEDEKVTFLIKFKEKADTKKIAALSKETSEKENLPSKKALLVKRSAIVSELKAISLQEQQNVKQYLEQEVAKGNVEDFNSYYIVNGIAVTATKEVAEKVASFEEVEKVLPNETRQLYTTKTEDAVVPESDIANVEWNIERVNAPDVWAMGIDGSGTVVASIDTGVQWDHPALKEKYRGYNASTGQTDHDFNWFDATAGQTTPYDDLGHGTHVTGTMVGSETNGSNQVGVAPGAKFISVKAFAANGGTDVDLLEAAQWILAPTDSEGNARVDMAPDVVNNSWGGGPGLDEWYRDVVTNWRAADIFPEFSAGNTTASNPGGPGSVASPANYPESFATGATDINNAVANFSLRGPSPYAEIKPDISAPGVNIRSSVPGGGYEGGWNGTSMSGPAISAVAAMLRQVNADLSVDEMEQILLDTAIPLTDTHYPETPNHGYGYGLVDAYEAVSSIMNGIGEIGGQVTKHGEDDEAPVFEHSSPRETYDGMDLDLTISVTDNVSVASVELSYLVENSEWQTVEASRQSGDYKSGEYAVTVPGVSITGDSFTYKWVINDFGNNEVISEEYIVEVKPGITVGYFEDFENIVTGWRSFGEMNSWELGVPTSGPGNAASGEKVYATNLDGTYDNHMNATLVLPPVDLPEGDSYLQFKHWHSFEQSSSGRAWDYGHVFISTNQQDWTQLQMFQGESGAWLDGEVNLSEYNGQRVYLAFHAFSDGSVLRDGWYIDDVALAAVSQTGDVANNDKEEEMGLGLIKDKDSSEVKEAIDPTKIRPLMPQKEDLAESESPINPTLLPLGAQVSVIESGRSVYTNPADGTYSITHTPGTFTVTAEAYGYHTTQQTVDIVADETAQADFTLEEVAQNVVSGTITDESTGEGVEGATVLLVEDANITPVVTDPSGNYSITAYEGDYTLKVIARGYHSKEASVTIGANALELNLALEPFYTYPGGEIGYDDGTAENARAFNAAGNAWAVKMSLPEGKENGIVTDGIFRFWDTEWPVPGGTEFALEVWDASGSDGTPGRNLTGSISATALRNGEWTVVDLTDHNIVVHGDFYMVYRQTFAYPNTAGLATDENGINAERSYQSVSGAWSASPAEEGNYMIRARVSYEVSTPVITSPSADLATNDPAITIEGTASPTTTIQLKNNGEEVGSVFLGDDGKFAIPTELTEGANDFTAVSILDGRVTGESAPVSVILDTVNPSLTIDSPINGDKTNRETVTVQGSVDDANLESVKVNGQDAAVIDGKYSKRILLNTGANEITVVATDLAKNSISKTVTITAKYDAPVIENVLPSEDVILKTGKTVKIEFDSEAGLKSTFVIHMPLTDFGGQVQNATELPMMEESDGHYVGYWTAPKGTVANGAVIEVKAVDSFKNETRQTAAGKLYINVKSK